MDGVRRSHRCPPCARCPGGLHGTHIRQVYSRMLPKLQAQLSVACWIPARDESCTWSLGWKEQQHALRNLQKFRATRLLWGLHLRYQVVCPGAFQERLSDIRRFHSKKRHDHKTPRSDAHLPALASALISKVSHAFRLNGLADPSCASSGGTGGRAAVGGEFPGFQSGLGCLRTVPGRKPEGKGS